MDLMFVALHNLHLDKADSQEIQIKSGLAVPRLCSETVGCVKHILKRVEIDIT